METDAFEPVGEAHSPFMTVFLALVRDRFALTGLILVGVLLVVSIIAPWIVPQNPYDLAELDILDGRLPPGSKSFTGMIFILGTDDQGRDLFSAILYGLRTSLVVGASSAAIALVLGAAAGLISAYAGGRTDAVIMRIVDMQLSFPAILIALILLAILGQGIDKIILALVVTQWAYYARTVRGSALVERRRSYVDAVICLALPKSRIIFSHILPNCLPPLIVVATMRLAYAIMLEATLSFLGIGLPVTEPSLGLLISNGFEYLLSGDYWISLFPGLALLVLVVGINLIGDGLRDILNPRHQG
jgi:peptide/nickel transport system permease protein